jgi:UDP-glucose 4-epimerase
MLKQGTRVLLTGGAGFLGARVARTLVGGGCLVRVLDDLSTGRRERLAGLDNGLELVGGDVRDASTVRRALAGAAVVIHLAGAPSRSDPVHAESVNVGGTLRLLEAARELDRRLRPRIVLGGSGSVYGRQNAFVQHEELAPRPAWPDAVGALAAEQLGRVYHEQHGLHVVGLRIFRTFGPEEPTDRADASVVARFVRAAVEGTSPIIFGDGQQTRDLVYVDNVVSAILAACDGPPDVYNIASGEAVTINFLWTLCLELTGKRRRAIDPTYVTAPVWEPQHARPQIARACKALGWAPSVRLREGLHRTVQGYLLQMSADPNAWFSPKQDVRLPRVLGPPRPPVPRRRDEAIEVSESDLVEEVEEAPRVPELDIEWAPVPAVRGLGRP